MSRLLDAQEHGRFRFRGPVQEPRHGTVLSQVLAEGGRGLLMQAAQVEQKFLLLVPKRTERDVDRRPAAGQFLTKILQAPAMQIRLHSHMGDQIEAVTGPRWHDFGQLGRTAWHRTTVPRGLTHGFACLKPAVFQADHGPAGRFLHAAVGRSRSVRAGNPRHFPGGVKAESHLGGQDRGLLELFAGLLLDLVKQGQQAQFRRFFSSA
jgi:hypothetical protein